MNLYGSTGLGSAGTGETSFGIVPGKARSPDVVAALQQMLSGRSASSLPAAPAGIPSMQDGPMSSLIGAGAPGTAPTSMGGQMMPPPKPPPNQQALAQSGQQVAVAPNNTLQIMQLLQHLRGSHTQTGSKK